MYINNINFDKDFIIKLNVLDLLSIISCKNIKISEFSNLKLKELYLIGNEISDINILEKVNFKELNKLYLNWNKISDINIIRKSKF